jgi:hypothetical protein
MLAIAEFEGLEVCRYQKSANADYARQFGGAGFAGQPCKGRPIA